MKCYRAVRHGLMRAKSVLLEPFYEFRMEMQTEVLGRAMTDVERMCGRCSAPEALGDKMVLSGSAPVAKMQGYDLEFASYTRGRGNFSCHVAGYAPCHNTEEVVEKIGYRPEADLDNTADSVFCSHGAGVVVPWQKAADFMHLEPVVDGKESSFGKEEDFEPGEYSGFLKEGKGGGKKGGYLGAAYAAEQELNEIFTRTFGEIKRRVPVGSHTLGQEALEKKSLKKQKREIEARETSRSVEIIKKELSDERLPEYLLVDGYNVIFAWDELAALAQTNLEAARGRLMDILCNYQGYTSYRLILVFDAYRVKGNPGEVQKYHNIHVVYTKEAETADMYIEKVSHELGKKYHVTVATSDALEQLIVIGQGAVRMSSRELKEEVERVGGKSLAQHAKKSGNGKNSQIKDALLKALGPGQAPYQEEKEKGR